MAILRFKTLKGTFILIYTCERLDQLGRGHSQNRGSCVELQFIFYTKK